MFIANADLCCQICEKTYATANSALSLDCALKHGCKNHMCFDCIQKSSFSEITPEKKCPFCRRDVECYTFAYFANVKAVAPLQDQVEKANAEVTRLQHLVALANADQDMLRSRLNAWKSWAGTARASLLDMPDGQANRAPVHVDRSRSPPSARNFEGEYRG